MFTKGDYLMKVIYRNGKKEWLLKNIKKPRNYHTHIEYNNKKAAQMICIRAYEGRIPSNYPVWMVESINRLWFGKDFLDRKDLNNSDLYTNDPNIRLKRKKKRKHKQKYVNKNITKKR